MKSEEEIRNEIVRIVRLIAMHDADCENYCKLLSDLAKRANILECLVESLKIQKNNDILVETLEWVLEDEDQKQ